MNQVIKDFLGKDDEKSKVYLNPDESVIELLTAKLAYHRSQISTHTKEASEIIHVLSLMKRYGVTKNAPGTIGSMMSQFYGGGEAVPYSIEDIKRRDFWMPRAIEYIKTCGILVQTADIFASAGLKTSEAERRSIMSTISLAMADLCEQGLLKKYKVEGVKGFFYGIPEMFNGDKPIVEF